MEEGLQRKPCRDHRDPSCCRNHWRSNCRTPDSEDLPEDPRSKDSTRTRRSYGLGGLSSEHGRTARVSSGGDSEGTHVSHARNIAAMAGAQGDPIELVAEKMGAGRKIRL